MSKMKTAFVFSVWVLTSVAILIPKRAQGASNACVDQFMSECAAQVAFNNAMAPGADESCGVYESTAVLTGSPSGTLIFFDVCIEDPNSGTCAGPGLCEVLVPTLQGPNRPSPSQPDYPSCSLGSIIQNDNQSVGETVPVVGTPFDLVYFSDRVIGREPTLCL